MNADRDVDMEGHLDDCLFKIEQATDLILETVQPLHDDPKHKHMATRLHFLARIIEDAVERARAMPDGTPR